MTIVHTHPKNFPDSRMETLQKIHRACVLAIQSNQGNLRTVFPKPTPIGVRY
ncbi:MAG: hypothetical protein K0S60_347 [Evtepia sp.]|jgi:hypothetical protein|nr:hypothetical protein [Evtepia sp.]